MELYQEKPELEIKGKKDTKEEPKNKLAGDKKQWASIAVSASTQTQTLLKWS